MLTTALNTLVLMRIGGLRLAHGGGWDGFGPLMAGLAFVGVASGRFRGCMMAPRQKLRPRPAPRPPERTHAKIEKHQHDPGSNQKHSVIWPVSPVGLMRHRFGVKTMTGKRKNTPVTSSHRMPPTRWKGRRKPPTPEQHLRWPEQFFWPPEQEWGSGRRVRNRRRLRLSLRRSLRRGWGLNAADNRSPAILPATRSPVPRTRPNICALIPFMMVAVTRGETLVALGRCFPFAPQRAWR